MRDLLNKPSVADNQINRLVCALIFVFNASGSVDFFKSPSECVLFFLKNRTNVHSCGPLARSCHFWFLLEEDMSIYQVGSAIVATLTIDLGDSAPWRMRAKHLPNRHVNEIKQILRETVSSSISETTLALMYEQFLQWKYFHGHDSTTYKWEEHSMKTHLKNFCDTIQDPNRDMTILPLKFLFSERGLELTLHIISRMLKVRCLCVKNCEVCQDFTPGFEYHGNVHEKSIITSIQKFMINPVKTQDPFQATEKQLENDKKDFFAASLDPKKECINLFAGIPTMRFRMQICGHLEKLLRMWNRYAEAQASGEVSGGKKNHQASFLPPLSQVLTSEWKPESPIAPLRNSCKHKKKIEAIEFKMKQLESHILDVEIMMKKQYAKLQEHYCSRKRKIDDIEEETAQE